MASVWQCDKMASYNRTIYSLHHFSDSRQHAPRKGATWENRYLSLLILNLDTWWEVCGQRHSSATLPPGQSPGEPHDRSARVWKTENLLPRIGVRTPDRQILRYTDYSFPASRFQRTATPNRPKYKGADKSLARPGTKQATATEDFDVHISYLTS
jgi:hypothetical protein